LILGSGSEIIRAVETRQQTIVITNKAVYSMQYLGPPFTFGVSRLSENISILAPTAATAIDDTVIWMGEEEFFIYDGTVKPLPCPVRDFVFENMDRDQPFKVVCGTNTAFGEVWWFYPCSISSECDRYVVYNYQQNIWYTGTLGRDAAVTHGSTVAVSSFRWQLGRTGTCTSTKQVWMTGRQTRRRPFTLMQSPARWTLATARTLRS
jgi:hypothetical protein